MRDDEAKRLILARRARFVAVALASVSVAAACSAEPCLSPIATDAGRSDADADDDAGDASTTDGGVVGEGGLKDAEPQPCLSPPKDP